MTDFELNVKVESFCGDKSCDDMLIHLKQYHPGVPGYAVKYDYFVTFKGENLAFEEYNVDCNLPRVRVIENLIIIPDEIRQLGETLKITVTHKTYPEYSSAIYIKMRKYEQTLEDNFDTYNTDLWVGVSSGAKTKMATTPKMDNYVRDGKLRLEFKKLDKPIIKDGVEYWYTDSGVKTYGKFSQKYGCFTARMKHPSYPTGVFTAFWLLPNGEYTKDYFFKRTDMGDDFHGCGEIDIMEIFCKPDTIGCAHTEHYWAPDWDKSVRFTKSANGKFYIIPGFKYGEYQEYSCVWNEYGIYYYVNGELSKANTNIAPVDDVQEAYILFTCYIFPEGCESKFEFYGQIKDEDLPQELVVDWVKVYK